MARQGHAFLTAGESRVVFQSEGEELKDVPKDGKTVGEIVTRGNISMKEVKEMRLRGCWVIKTLILL
jgi:hypothetical protein